MKKLDIETREQIEIAHWKDPNPDDPTYFALENIAEKMAEARVFLSKTVKHAGVIKRADEILEIGAGQGWASCILKLLFNEKTVYASDISPYSLAYLENWERMFDVKLDQAFTCKSYEIPLPDESVDMVFCYSSAHHFADIEKTLRDSYRVLREGGSCMFLQEPSCRRYIYPLAFWRVTRKRPEVPEDVLVFKEIEKQARAEGYEVSVSFDPDLVNRGPMETVYYLVLSKSKLLQSALPCSMDYVFTK